MSHLRRHHLLVWAVWQKMAKGMSTADVEDTYGIPACVAWVWRRLGDAWTQES